MHKRVWHDLAGALMTTPMKTRALPRDGALTADDLQKLLARRCFRDKDGKLLEDCLEYRELLKQFQRMWEELEMHRALKRKA